MSDVSGRATAFRLSILVGAAALALGGSAAGAQAFPAAPTISAPFGAETVQFYGDARHPHHMYRHHHRYGENYHPSHPGYAGHYDCGPGGKATHLSRRACGGNDRFAHLKGYRYE